MESINQQVPMLSVPLKMTDEADFTEAFRKYIEEHYQEDPDNYSNEIAIFNRLRQDIRGVGKDMTGRDILYRYYGQLELLDLRFPLDEKHVKVHFTWYDAFSEEGISQYSGAYEKACVIFNIAAILSNIAATQNRFEEEGRKVAYNYFQASAGLFQFINDNFLHAPSIDIRSESVKCLNKLMLASAQECFLEKTIFEKKKSNLLSKIASYLAFTYSEISDDMDVVELRSQFDGSWTSLVKVKSKYYSTISHYYKALASADEGKYGHVISYLTLSENYAKEANKLAKSFSSNYPSFSVSSSDTQSASSGKSTSASQALLEATKAYLTLITEKKKQAIKDNDIIYQEIVPNADTLEAPEKLCVVKNLNFVDICPNGQKEAQGIIGQDVFHRLIPISVHEASSLYSEEKAKILRAEMERCENADTDFKLLMETQDIINTVNKSKEALKNDGINESMISFPNEISSYCNLIQQESKSGKSISSTITSLNSLQTKTNDKLNNIGLELDKEQREYDLKLQLYNMKWTQEPSVTASANIRQNLKKYRSSLEEAINADNKLIAKYNNNKKNIESLEQPIDKVKSDYINSILSGNSKPEDSVNLIDVNMDDVNDKKQIEKEKIEKIEALIMNLRGCQGERKKLIDDLKYKIQNDDISNILLVKRHKEKQIFQNELGKFQDLRNNISRNINDHTNFLHTLTEEFNQLKSESESFKSVNSINQKKEQKDKEYKEAYELWKEIYKNIESGIRLYTNLNEVIDNLTMETNKYVSQRLAQRNELEKNIKETKAADDQKILLSKLNSLNLSSTNTPTSATPYKANVLPLDMQGSSSNYFSNQQNVVTSPNNIITTSIPASNVAILQSPSIMQKSSVMLNNPVHSLVTSSTQPSSQSLQSSQQPITTPLYQQPHSASINQQTPLATPLTSLSQSQIQANQTQLSAYSSYQQSQQSTQIQNQQQQSQNTYQSQQSSSLNMQNQTALKLQQALTNQVQTQVQTPIQPLQTPIQPQQTPIQPQQTPIQPLQTPIQPQQTPIQPLQTPIQPQQTPIQPQQTPIQPQQTPIQPQQTPIQPLQTPIQPQQTPIQPQTNYQLPVSSTPSYQQQFTTTVSSAPTYQAPVTYQRPFQQPQQTTYAQLTTSTTAYLSAYATPTQQQTQPITTAYSTTPTVTTQNYSYQQNAYNNIYKSQIAQPTAINTTPALPPKPTADQDPLSSQMTSQIRPPLPPPPGSVNFGQTSSSGNFYSQIQQPQQPQQPQQQPSTTYMNYYTQPTTATTTSNYMNQYTIQPQLRPLTQTPMQPQSYYNSQQPQYPQQPVYTTLATNTTNTAYGYQQQQQQNSYYPPPTQQTQVQQQQQNYYQPPTNTTPGNYYQTQTQQQNSSAIAQVNSIQNQQLASLSQYKPLKPQQYTQPSLLD